jgi:DNA-directed RNA polymerase subunit RPC12/RpoP
MNIERCGECKRPFDVSQIGGQMPGTKEREDISCPYCSYTIQRICNGGWRTLALSTEYEQEYNREHPM